MLKQEINLHFEFKIMLTKTRHVTKPKGCFSYLSKTRGAAGTWGGADAAWRLRENGKSKSRRHSRYRVNLNFK